MTAEAPTASTLRFALLIAAVVAAGNAMFININGHVPGQAEALIARQTYCGNALRADAAYPSGPATPDIRDSFLPALRRFRTCLRPALAGAATTDAIGLAALFGLAGAGYLAYPWWTVRRRRLRRLSTDDLPELVTYVDGLSREIGLTRPPAWWLAPHRRTAGGQAFGTPWRRSVQLDAGLVVRFATDRPAFRAVVLHELAHLKNRDVDKTYLTLSIWRAFLLVAVLPYFALTVHPLLLTAPLNWGVSTVSYLVHHPASTAYEIVTPLVLIILVYLIRNAILRVREVHADAVAAAQDGPDSALPAVLARLPVPPPGRRRWWTRWGTHPDPALRLDAVRDPRRLFDSGGWELFGAGFAAGYFVANLTFTVNSLPILDAYLGYGIAGLVAGGPMAAGLAVWVWRAVAGAPDRRPPARIWLTGPLVLAAGFLAGQFLDIYPIRPHLLPDASVSAWASWGIAGLVLGAGAVGLATVVTSASRGILASSPRRRWAMPAVVVIAALLGGTMLAVWLVGSFVPFGFGLRFSDPPATGADIGWYAHLVRWTDWQFIPSPDLVYNPLTLPCLTLLWAVPVAAGLRRRGEARVPDVDRVPVGRAAVAALIGGACVAIFAAVLPFLAKAALPDRVRERPAADVSGEPFALVVSNLPILAAKLAVVVVIAVMVARNRRHRPVLALSAATFTALLSTVAIWYVSVPMQCAANVTHRDPAPVHCLHLAGGAYLADMVNFTLVEGLILAIPIAVLSAAATGWLRRGRAPVPDPIRPARLTFAQAAGALAVVAVTVGYLTWANLPASYDLWLKASFG